MVAYSSALGEGRDRTHPKYAAVFNWSSTTFGYISAEDLKQKLAKKKREVDNQGSMTWQEAKSKAEAHVKAHDGVIPSINRLAKFVGCSHSTIRKAIQASSYLRARKAEHSRRPTTGRTTGLSDPIIEGWAQTTEPQPDTAAMLAELTDEQRKDRERDVRQYAKVRRKAKSSICRATCQGTILSDIYR